MMNMLSVPPSLLMPFQQLGNAQTEMENAAAEWEKHVRGMQDQANSLFGTMQQQMDAPTPSASPVSQFLINLLGNTSQALAPNMGGQQAAQQALESPIKSAMARRQERLSMLRDTYDRMATAALNSGNDMLHAKHAQAAEKYEKLLTELGMNQRNSADIASREREGALDRASAERIAAGNQAAGIREAGIRASDTNKSALAALVRGGWTFTGGPNDDRGDVANWVPPGATLTRSDFTKQWSALSVVDKNPRTGEAISLPEEERAKRNNAARQLAMIPQVHEVNNPVQFVRRLESTTLPFGSEGGWFGVGKVPAPKMIQTDADRVDLFNQLQAIYNRKPGEIAWLLQQAGWSPDLIARTRKLAESGAQ